MAGNSKTRRCMWYEDEGRPRVMANGHVGCPRKGKCNFIHPDDPLWTAASASRTPDPALLYSHPAQPPRIQSGAGQDRAGFVHPQRRALLNSTSSDTSDPQTHLSRSAKKRKAASTRSPSTVPPSPIQVPPAFVPPDPPHGKEVTAHNIAPQTEPSPEQKRLLWIDRIKLLTQAVIVRVDHVKLQSEMLSNRRLCQSWRYNDLAEETRLSFDEKVAELMKQCEQKKAELNTIVEQLTKRDFWPLGQMPPTALADLNELKSAVAELKLGMKKTYESLQEVNARIALPSSSGAEPLDTSSASTSADHIPPSVETRPLKRRRLSQSESGATDSGDPKPSRAARSAVALELDKRLTMLEVHLGDVEGEMVQRDHDLLAEIDDKVQIRMDQYFSHRSARRQAKVAGRNSDMVEPPAASTSSNDNWQHLAQEIAVFGGQLGELGGQLGELAEEVAGLILTEANTATHIENLKRENEQLRRESEELRERVASQGQSLDLCQRQMQALNHMVEKILERPPDPPSLSMEMIIQTITPTLLHSIHAELRPVLLSIKNNAEDSVRT